MIHATANAKINLSLEILGRRPDGYHDIVTIMQAIDLTDELVFLPAPDGEITLECNDPGLDATADNTVLRAAEALRDAAGIADGARILLRKAIPVTAGLGGGSSDAAATLTGLARLWGTRLPPARMAELATGIGADVSFFMGESPTAFVEGRGETITRLPQLPEAWVVIAIPEVPIPSPKTRVLYRMLEESHFTDGRQARGLHDRIRDGASRADIISGVGVANTFNAVADRAFPGIDRFRAIFRGAVGDKANVSLSGAGPALYAMMPTEQAALDVNSTLTEEGVAAIVARTADRPLTVLER